MELLTCFQSVSDMYMVSDNFYSGVDALEGKRQEKPNCKTGTSTRSVGQSKDKVEGHENPEEKRKRRIWIRNVREGNRAATAWKENRKEYTYTDDCVCELLSLYNVSMHIV